MVSDRGRSCRRSIRAYCKASGSRRGHPSFRGCGAGNSERAQKGWRRVHRRKWRGPRRASAQAAASISIKIEHVKRGLKLTDRMPPRNAEEDFFKRDHYSAAIVWMVSHAFLMLSSARSCVEIQTATVREWKTSLSLTPRICTLSRSISR